MENKTATIYRSDDFLNLYALMAHEETLNTEEWLLRTLISIFLLKSLQLSQFFKNISLNRKHSNGDVNNTDATMTDDIVNDDLLSEEELLVCKVILRLINICPTNCHDVSEFETPVLDAFTTACNKVSIGAAIYPTLALFNHACDPSFMRCNKGNGVVCVANRRILKGKIKCVYIILKQSVDLQRIKKMFMLCFTMLPSYRGRNMRKLWIGIYYQINPGETKSFIRSLQIRMRLPPMCR